MHERQPFAKALAKAPTGIQGLDEITLGGLPRGRPTLVCGSAGSGKTLLGMEFLVRGTQLGEPGVCITFEERVDDLIANVASLGFDLPQLIAEKKLRLDHVQLDRSQIEEAGEYDLEGLFVRLGYAIDAIGAQRVLLDTIEALFAGLSNTGILRAELARLFGWLKDRGVTTIVTGERGEGQLTRHGLEEYVSDCVILLEHRVSETIFTRRLRVVKYRGSVHGTNAYPFLIDEHGISVLPITSLALQHTVLDERISTGVPRLDTMLGGKGYYRGSSILVSGTSGTGKTSLGVQFVHAACGRGERCLYFGFEESLGQITRNMRSVGIDLAPWVQAGLLQYYGTRTTSYGLEMHLVKMHKLIEDSQPSVVVIDPVTSFLSSGTANEVRGLLTRLIDFLKSRHMTAFLTTLTSEVEHLEQTDVHVSSLIDTWLVLRDVESGGERNRGLMILKSRGMAHSNQIREFLLTENGIELRDVYIGPTGVLTGSARLAQEAREEDEERQQLDALEERRRQSKRKRTVLEAQLAALQADIAAEDAELQQYTRQEERRRARQQQARASMAQMRHSDASEASESSGNVTHTGEL
ncbi:MAG TPA: circadian clock protein KaiC [Candidatus Tectomicrobia bacterium]